MNTSTAPLVVVAALVVALVAFVAHQNRRLIFDSCPASVEATWVSNPHNDKALIVHGWSSEEIKKILNDFAATYRMQRFKYLVRTEQQRLRVVFPDDIEPSLFSFLVNYVQYPKDFDLKDRSIVSTGTATLLPDFGLPSPALSGQKALFYIPANDTKYDLVFVRVGEQSYENSFAGKCWQPMNNPRLPEGVEQYGPARQSSERASPPA